MAIPDDDTFWDKVSRILNPFAKQQPHTPASIPLTPHDEQAAVQIVMQRMAEQGIVSLTPHQTEQALHLAQLMVISVKLGEEKLRRQDEYNALLTRILTENTTRNPTHQQEMERAIEQERVLAANHLDDLLRQARQGILKEAVWQPPEPPPRIIKDVTPEREEVRPSFQFRGCFAQLIVLVCTLVIFMVLIEQKGYDGSSLPYRKVVLIMQLASRADAPASVVGRGARESLLGWGDRPGDSGRAGVGLAERG